jgi:DNA-binding MarR family transcriptional regulator
LAQEGRVRAHRLPGSNGQLSAGRPLSPDRPSAASHPGTRVRDIAYDLDMTERRVYLILRELEDTGYITRRRHGNRVEFTIHQRESLRAPLARDVTIRQLLELLGAGDTQ